MREKTSAFGRAFDQLALGMAQVGVSGRFIRVNARLCEILGYSPEELEGRTFASITHPDDKKGSKSLLQMMSERKEPAISFEKRYLAKGGATVWVRVTSSAVVNEKGEVQYFNSILEDITEKKNDEIEASEQKLRMIAASRINMVGRLAAGISHEINNPLTIVMGQAHRMKKMAESGSVDAEKLSEIAGQIENMAQQIAEIIARLRSFAREGSDEPISRVSLSEVLKGALRFSRAGILTSRIDLKVIESSTEVFVKIRAVQVMQAFLNLINNARDAVEGRKPAQILIQILAEKATVAIEIHDSGEGLPQELEDQVFQPFFTTKPVGLGTGLGLSITKDIIEQYDGRISYMRSHLGGACFRVTFPKE